MSQPSPQLRCSLLDPRTLPVTPLPTGFTLSLASPWPIPLGLASPTASPRHCRPSLKIRWPLSVLCFSRGNMAQT